MKGNEHLAVIGKAGSESQDSPFMGKFPLLGIYTKIEKGHLENFSSRTVVLFLVASTAGPDEPSLIPVLSQQQPIVPLPQ